MHRSRYRALRVVVVALSASVACEGVWAQTLGDTTAPADVALHHEIGTWDAVSKSWSAPDATPTLSRGVETNKMFGQIWVIGVFESDFDGVPFRGQSQIGYDPETKKYVGTWIDTMSPSLNTFEGTMQGNKLTLMTYDEDRETGKKKLTKMVSTYIDEDHKTFESFEPVPGKEDQWWKTMEVQYTKRN